MFNFMKKRNQVAEVVNTMETVEPKYGIHTLYENTTLCLKNGTIISPKRIEVHGHHTNIEYDNQIFNSVDVLDSYTANVFGHEVDILSLDVFNAYTCFSTKANTNWIGAKEKDGVRSTIFDVKWAGELESGTTVFFTDEDNQTYKTEVYDVEFKSFDFIVFTTNKTGTRRYFVFK